MPSQTADYIICKIKVSTKIKKQPQTSTYNLYDEKIIMIGVAMQVVVYSEVYTKYGEGNVSVLHSKATLSPPPHPGRGNVEVIGMLVGNLFRKP